ncbi:sulfatase [Radiobacillus sp. PE A8.2]|uniref:sulfatase family protein n=1 Tax=Radiobacillus sp. PE A8.2 TaxID=3380349 RepID=UPI00388FB9C3
MEKPNIILITSHDTGRYLGCYGRGVETPEINQLAEEGIRFDQYFCPAPQCSPSRGSMISGMYPNRHGLMGLGHLGFSMKPEIVTLPKAMTACGYESVLIGLSHERIDDDSSPEAIGYERFEAVPGNRAHDVADKVEAFLQEKASTTLSRPFYASVGLHETHRKGYLFDEYEPVQEEQVDIPSYLPNTSQTQDDFAHFQGSVKLLDQAVGRIVQSLKDTGLENDTLIIYTTDHGIAFPRAKGTLFDAGLETAFIMRWTNGFRGGRVQNELLCNIDLMPTLIEIAGGEAPINVDGESFLPLLKEESEKARNQFFCELSWHDLYHPMRGVRTNRYKYIRNFEAGPSVYMPADIYQSPSGCVVRDAYSTPNQKEELYDLKLDPLEQNNLIHDASYSHLLTDLRKRVVQWMEQNHDPLLDGPIPGQVASEWERIWSK